MRFGRPLPPQYQALHARGEADVVLEVESHIAADAACCIALTATRGLARGAGVRDTGSLLSMPIGPDLLGRVLDVFGRPIDREPPVDAAERWPIHRAPLPLAHRVTSREIFVTGVKAMESYKVGNPQFLLRSRRT